jgi:hypothetical protein
MSQNPQVAVKCGAGQRKMVEAESQIDKRKAVPTAA